MNFNPDYSLLAIQTLWVGRWKFAGSKFTAFDVQNLYWPTLDDINRLLS